MEEKTREEIEDLKRQWFADPCWDLEFTEGFEAHQEELKKFQQEKELEWQLWKEEEAKKLLEEEKKEMEVLELDYPRHYALFRRIKAMESYCAQLDERLVKIEENMPYTPRDSYNGRR